MNRLDPRNPNHRGPNSRILGVTIAAFVAAIVVAGIWGLSQTDDIDPTPLATNGPPGPGSIEAGQEPAETGAVGTEAPAAD
jgi:hypothetical protein